MIPLTLGEIANIVDGEVRHVDKNVSTSQYPVIDSRLVTPDTFFVAIKGESLNGHDFAGVAIEAGADFVLATEEVGVPSIIVSSCENALKALAAHIRSELKEMVVIGITGSQGKTTTKDIAKYIFSLDGQTVATEGSFNNELGLPLTVLRADHKTKYLILEMGARHVGDISHLCSIAQPNIGAVLIVGTAHIEIFGSQAAIAKAKGELITSLRPTGVAVLGNFDPFTPRMADGLGIRSIHFGIESAEDELQVRATDIELRDGMPHFELVTPEARESLTLNFIGEHQVANALAAAAIARAAGISFEKICEGLSMATPSSNFRMQVTEVAGVLIINDSYNANPASMKAAIATLRHFSQARGGESWAFLGRMHELGEDELSDHKMIGELLPHEGIDHLVEIGSWGIAQGVKDSNLEVTQIHETSDRDEASLMFPRIQSGDCVLIKASRAETLEVLATQLINELETRDLKVDQETTTTSKSHEKNKNEEKTL